MIIGRARKRPRQVCLPHRPRLLTPLISCLRGSLIPIDLDFEGSLMADNPAHSYDRRKSLLCSGVISQRLLADSEIRCDVGQVVTIDVLSDDALLAIFDFYVVPYQDLDLYDAAFSRQRTKKNIESWQLLVHVCRRWRGLVFASPRRLNLQLFYEPGKSARKPRVWPALPLIIKGHVFEASVDNVIAELGQRDHITQINLSLFLSSRSQIENIWTALQAPFPELAGLFISHEDVSCAAPVLPDSFLGGSALRLRYVCFSSIPFPGFPNLLLSSTHLVTLFLSSVPHSGYFSPEAMATCLSVLTSLEYLLLEFESPQSTPDEKNRRPRSPTLSVLPSLTKFLFKGVNKYLEELVARIDTPRICLLEATFLHDIDFDSPELIRFVSRSSTINSPKKAQVFFDYRGTSVRLRSQASNYFQVGIPWSVPGWQLSSPAQICTASFPLLSRTEKLFICEEYNLQVDWEYNAQDIRWLELLRPFTALRNLYLSKQFAPHFASALREISGDGTTAVLYTLENLYVEGFEPSKSVEEDIERFISARQLTNRPVAISAWEIDSRHTAYYI